MRFLVVQHQPRRYLVVVDHPREPVWYRDRGLPIVAPSMGATPLKLHQ